MKNVTIVSVTICFTNETMTFITMTLTQTKLDYLIPRALLDPNNESFLPVLLKYCKKS